MSEFTSDDVPRANGMPRLGLGTWENTDPDACANAVETALETGYRHIDTAQAYGNEESVGRGIANADVDREDVFLATKVWIDHADRDGVIESTEESLDKLGVDYVDLLYIHWPGRTYDPEETLPALEELKAEGTIEHIGVSNFERRHVEEAREIMDEPIFANQVEMHPFLQQRQLRSFMDETDIELVAYSPLARGEVFGDDVLGDIAADHDASEAQVALAWLREKGVTAIPKATSADHIADNWGSLGVELSDAEIRRIDAIDAAERRVDPGFAPWNALPDQ
ncbi:aldo/keto reductase [Halarchaeum nitratireducens]|uniref:Aldehyde oxidoreductase n=1 Tax=Halarchaeum nitratireducens TaxID=489913 RepID=A0A830GB67_9EURY|nr:2,5-diketo-D-gluconate reductase B [Halarchaeum solikamskense]GGN17785.1 aldehyde oxidoreductase [Halarchaeum nitratireducens]